ncbi:MAG: hypothetical protein H6Q34_1042, partial [Deltaproteobacteria bacterium]|nr:hypothetical protein [Deltaproteobacteria bacterium]
MAALIDAMTMSADVPWTSFLDLQEGTVIDSGGQEAEDDDDDDESVSELALDPERYAEIP